MFELFLHKLPKSNNNFLKNSNNLLLQTTSLNQPMFNLGFHYFLYRTKSNLSITDNLESENEFYNIVNPFESKVVNYEDNINQYFLKSIKDESILSYSFYNYWEILSIFELTTKDNMSIGVIGDGIGSVTQSIVKFREILEKKTSDKIYNVSIKSEKGNYDTMDKTFVGNYKKNLTNHKTYTSLTAKKHTNKDNGDIRDLKTIDLYVKDFKNNQAELIICNAKPNSNDVNMIEKEYYKILLGEIITTLKVQKKSGHCVIRLDETFTITTIKIIYLLCSFYENCFVYKPFFSKDSLSDKYIICKNFEYNTNEVKNHINILEEMVQKIDDNIFINDIFLDLDIPKEYLDVFKYININISNKQQILINKIITYIKQNNYFGDSYHNYKDNQIKANKWWLENFTQNLDNIKKTSKQTIEFNKDELVNFLKHFD